MSAVDPPLDALSFDEAGLICAVTGKAEPIRAVSSSDFSVVFIGISSWWVAGLTEHAGGFLRFFLVA